MTGERDGVVVEITTVDTVLSFRSPSFFFLEGGVNYLNLCGGSCFPVFKDEFSVGFIKTRFNPFLSLRQSPCFTLLHLIFRHG